MGGTLTVPSHLHGLSRFASTSSSEHILHSASSSSSACDSAKYSVDRTQQVSSIYLLQKHLLTSKTCWVAQPLSAVEGKGVRCAYKAVTCTPSSRQSSICLESLPSGASERRLCDMHQLHAVCRAIVCRVSATTRRSISDHKRGAQPPTHARNTTAPFMYPVLGTADSVTHPPAAAAAEA